MKVRDILPSYAIEQIEVRINHPYGGDMLFGFCKWDGVRLTSLDGDDYFLDEEISNYEFNDDGTLTYWIICTWS